MELVINVCHGGFGLSDAAVEECVKRGMTLTESDEKGHQKNPDAHFCKFNSRLFKDQHYYCNEDYGKKRNAFRSNPILVTVVKELGEKADGTLSQLKVIDIPFNSVEGWEITDYDGMERVEEIHNSWS
jgi:hypothetical protein